MNPKIASFLQKIAQLESSGGTNTNHPMMKSGLHKNTHAVGTYGLMPATVQEIINRQKRDGNIDPGVASLSGMDNEGLSLAIKEHPELEQNLAGYLANRVLTRQNGNDEASAYAWFNGSNLSPDRITDDKLESSDYVNKFKDLKNKEISDNAKKRALELLASND